MKTSIINGDPYHCRCYSIDPFDIENFEEELRNLGFSYPLLEQNKGHVFGLVLALEGDKQIHVKVMPNGQIEAEVEPIPDFPFAHLNQKHSYSAHKELGEIFKNYLSTPYKKKLIPPLTCIRRIIIEPVNPTPIETVVVGGLVALLIGGALYYLTKDENKR